MSIEHVPQEQLARIVTAIAIGLLGILEIATPGCFGSIRFYFRGARAALGPEQRARLQRVVDARVDAEGTDVYTRYAGVFTIAMAGLALLPAVPMDLPYTASCAALAIAVFLAYLHFRRGTERRVAPLVRRNAWASLPPVVLACAGICIVAALSLTAYPQYRIPALAAALSGIVLCAIAWRVAVAPAMLFGDDAQLEYLVDEHVRFCRATGLIALACAPPTNLVLFAWAELHVTPPLVIAATWAVLAAFLVVLVVSLNPVRKRIMFA
ncbi:MAG: hypothetical protein WB615_02855 [Candidatus Tumulicola sp.]